MVFISELRVATSGKIDSRFFDVVPEFCEACESPLDMNLALTELSCSNPMCSDKITMRISKMCDSLGIKFMGEATIEKWLANEDIISPLQFFKYKDGSYIPGLSAVISDKVTSQLAGASVMKLWEYVSNAQLSYIQTSAKQLLEGYSSLEDFYMDLEVGTVEFVQNRLGIGEQFDDYGNPTVSKRALRIYTSLMAHKDELLGYIGYVTIEENSSLPEYIIVMSDEVGGGFKRKKDFFTYITERYRQHAQFVLGSSVTKKTNFVIWKGFDGSPATITSKVKRTYELYNSGLPIEGYTALEFIEAFDSRFGIVEN